MTADEKRADEIAAACSRAAHEGIDPRSVLLIALASERRRALLGLASAVWREFGSGIDQHDSVIAHVVAFIRRRARGAK